MCRPRSGPAEPAAVRLGLQSSSSCRRQPADRSRRSCSCAGNTIVPASARRPLRARLHAYRVARPRRRSPGHPKPLPRRRPRGRRPSQALPSAPTCCSCPVHAATPHTKTRSTQTSGHPSLSGDTYRGVSDRETAPIASIAVPTRSGADMRPTVGPPLSDDAEFTVHAIRPSSSRQAAGRLGHKVTNMRACRPRSRSRSARTSGTAGQCACRCQTSCKLTRGPREMP
jgi:hypothetical protein